MEHGRNFEQLQREENAESRGVMEGREIGNSGAKGLPEEPSNQVLPQEPSNQAREEEPSNQALLEEIRRLQGNLQLLTIAFIVFFVLFCAACAFVFFFLRSYQADLEEAFNTVRRIDQMVDQLENSYSQYSDKIQQLFDTMEQLQALIQGIRDTLSGIPFLN